MSDWISVLDRLPEPGERVIATDGAFIGEAWLNGYDEFIRTNFIYWNGAFNTSVTHWQPMPDAPKESDRC